MRPERIKSPKPSLPQTRLPFCIIRELAYPPYTQTVVCTMNYYHVRSEEAQALRRMPYPLEPVVTERDLNIVYVKRVRPRDEPLAEDNPIMKDSDVLQNRAVRPRIDETSQAQMTVLEEKHSTAAVDCADVDAWSSCALNVNWEQLQQVLAILNQPLCL
eukprot:TRINITY_DN11319_c0_g2_i1.p1 TRINITY_DN11319_c0_g2~~TRINITY_DN11319_c0_g2_i1.p1  ORF type:complete len:159 (-),score=22.43 TRINITY_DN11319_c0_g2_i1:27-503(-)